MSATLLERVRTSKAVLIAGFVGYIVLSVLSALVIAYGDVGRIMGQPVGSIYLIDINLYKLVLLLDKPLMFIALILAAFLDNNPGADKFAELKADIAFMFSGLSAGWGTYAIVFCLRVRYIVQGGLPTVMLDEYFNQGIIGIVCVFIFYHAVRLVVKMAQPKK